MQTLERPDPSVKNRPGRIRNRFGDAGIGLAVLLMATVSGILDLAPGRREVPTLEIAPATCGDDGDHLAIAAVPTGTPVVAQLHPCVGGTLSVVIDVDPGTRARVTFVALDSADASLDVVISERTEWVRNVEAGEAWMVGWTGNTREGRAWIVAASLEPRP